MIVNIYNKFKIYEIRKLIDIYLFSFVTNCKIVIKIFALDQKVELYVNDETSRKT